MIICRKPFTLHDVDLLGLVGLTVLGALAWWLVVLPWQRTWASYRELAGRHAAAQASLRGAMAELTKYRDGLDALRSVIAAEAENVPQAASISRMLRDMTGIARESGIEILSVVPRPAARDGDYVVNDIHVLGQGRSLDFMRFLNRLAEANPYQSLQQCSIQRSAEGGEPRCRLAWQIRLYLLPVEAESRRGDPS